MKDQTIEKELFMHIWHIQKQLAKKIIKQEFPY